MKLGTDCKLYHGDALLDGDTSTPDVVTWTEIDLVKDITRNDSKDEIDGTTRKNGRIKGYDAGFRDVGLDIQIPYRPDDEGFQALETAYQDNDAISLAIMDGDISVDGTKGVVGNFILTGFPHNEPLTEEANIQVTAKPYIDHQIEDYTVTVA